MHYQFCIVGSGLSGAVIAEHAARDGCKVLVLEKRNHVAGNVYDAVDQMTGIRVSHYGAHLFHTSDQEVWQYVQRFGDWQRWEHKVIAYTCDNFVPIPVNPTTVNLLLNENISDEKEMLLWLASECRDYTNEPTDGWKNSKEVALSRVGPRLYELLFEEYTRKQWNKDAANLDPSVLARIPIRTSFDVRYFSEKYQALPVAGYTAIVEAMLSSTNIIVHLNTEWSEFQQYNTNDSWDHLIFTGPIDQYFAHFGLPKLEYRSINFEWHRFKLPGYLQPNSVVNYPSASVPYTRSVEYKHFLNQKSDWTIISYETSSEDGEPFYPVPTQANQLLYKHYQELSSDLRNVHFVGRLANYKYFNMDQAIRNSMDYYRKQFSLNYEK